MHSYDAIVNSPRGGRAIRWPFRALAAVVVLVIVLATLASGYVAFSHHDLRAAVLALSLAPMAALVGRLGAQVVLRGTVTQNPNWPFASGAAASAWILIALVVGAHFFS